MDPLLVLFRFIPKNLLSLLVGAIVRLRLPRPVARWLVSGFVRAFRLDLTEAQLRLEDFATIEDVFIRRLKPDARPVQPPICSPADGYLAVSAPAELGRAVQAKGRSYNLIELIFDRDPKRPYDFDPHWYQTVYLAPHNYHRVHAPFSGVVERVRYVPGELWPVNAAFVRRVVNLFSRNERLVFDFKLDGGGRAYVIMVGATNVGRMVTPLVPELVTNSAMRQLTPLLTTHEFPEPRRVTIGDELGTFMLGSTVVVVYDKLALSGLSLLRCEDLRPVLMGQALTGDLS
jgi:phosphatidylserine decarboxylase